MNKLRLLLSIALLASLQPAFSEEPDKRPIAVAVLDFAVDPDANLPATFGADIAQLLNVDLSAEGELAVVERISLQRLLEEQSMGLSGTVNTETAAQLGTLTGLEVFVAGRAFKVGRDTFLVARVIGAENGRVFGMRESMKNLDQVSDSAESLAAKITHTLKKERAQLLVPPPTKDAHIESLRDLVKGHDSLPSFYISIPEEHIGRAIPDPAAETEIARTLIALGFPMVQSSSQADFVVTGEAFSEFAMTIGPLRSCRARLEVKVVDRETGKVVLMDRETTGAADSAEHIAGKNALQKAGLKVSERVVKAIVQPEA